MNPLQDWINQLLSQPISALNRKYCGVDFGAAEIEVESLPDVEPLHSLQFAPSRVENDVLERLHSKIRNRRCEAAIWDAIIFRLLEPLPTSIAHDLIDRDIVINQLGHTRQNDEIQWRLALLVDEALLTLFRDLYTKPNYQIEELDKLLKQHPNHQWLLDKWEYWAQESSSREKEIAFHLWAWQHPNRPADLPNPEDYLELIAYREQQESEERLRAEAEEKEEQLQIESKAHQRHLELQRISKEKIDQAEIELILSSQETDTLLALANNSRIEIQWIEKLVNCHHVKSARQIRETADQNIKARQSHLE